VNGPAKLLVSNVTVPSEYRFWSAEYSTNCTGDCPTEFDPSTPLADGPAIYITPHHKYGSKILGDFVLLRETQPAAPLGCLYGLNVSGFPTASNKDELWGRDAEGIGQSTNVWESTYPVTTITTAGKFPLGADWGEIGGGGLYFSGLRRIELEFNTSANPNYCATLTLYPQEVWTPYSSRRWESQTGYCWGGFTIGCPATNTSNSSCGVVNGTVPTDERYWEIDGFQVNQWDSPDLSVTPKMEIKIPNPADGLNDMLPYLGQDLSQSTNRPHTVYMNRGTKWNETTCNDFSTVPADASTDTYSGSYNVVADIQTKFGSYCECWSNPDGDGCLPFPQNDTQPDIAGYVTGLVASINGTTYTQNGASAAGIGRTIAVPTDNGNITLSASTDPGAGRKVRVQVPDMTPYNFDIDSCSGAITGTSGGHTISMNWPHGEDCNNCPDELVTGCCEYADGSVSRVNGSAACSGTYSGDDTTCPPVGCCALVGSPDESGVTEAYCDGLGGTWSEGASCDGTGWCINDTDGSVTSGVEENDCTGTWSATEPTMGCCTISGTQNPDVAEQWCTAQSGTFVTGDCPEESTDWTSVSARIEVQSLDMYCDDPTFSCFEDAYLPSYIFSSVASNPYTSSGTRTATLSGDVADGEDNSLNPTFQQVTVIVGATGTLVTVQLTFDGGQTISGQVLLPSPTADCPVVSWSGALTTWSGTWTQTCSGTAYDASDWAGIISLSLNCEP